jgi:hypothetical protein
MTNNTEKNNFWNMSTKSQWEEGLNINCEVSSDDGDGELSITPSKNHGYLDPTDPEILSMTVTPGGTVICGMASGKVIAKDPMDGTVTYLYNNKTIYPGMGNITALTMDGEDRLWGGCSDNGRIFILDGNMGENRSDLGKLVLFDNYISVLAYSPKHNAIWGGTGILGWLFRVDVETGANSSYSAYPIIKTSIECMIYDEMSQCIWAGSAMSKDGAPTLVPQLLKINTNVTEPFNFSRKDVPEAGDGISSLCLNEEERRIYMGTMGDGKLIDWDIDSLGGTSYGGLPNAPKAVTSLYFGQMSHNLYLTTVRPPTILGFNIGQKSFEVLLTDSSNTFKAFDNLMGDDEMMGMWCHTDNNSELMQVIPVGLWISPVFNASETVIWDYLDIEAELPDTAVVFGLIRYFDNLSAVNMSEFDEENIFFSSTALDINDTQYIQFAFLLQNYNPFKTENTPILFSYNLSFDFYPKMEMSLTSGNEETVRNGIINYTLYLNNTSDGTAATARTSFIIPGGTQLTSASHPYTEAAGEVSLDFINITRDSQEVILFNLTVDDDVAPGTSIGLEASLNYSGIHERYQPGLVSNNVAVSVNEPSVGVELSLEKDRVNPMEDVPGKILINVSDKMDITKVNVSMTIPGIAQLWSSSLDWGNDTSDSNNSVFWNIDLIEKGIPYLIDLTVQISTDASDHEIIPLLVEVEYYDGLEVNKYTIESSTEEIVVVEPLVTFDLMKSKRDLEHVEVGQTVPFFVQYSNLGHDVAKNATITVHFSDNLEYPTNPSLEEIVWTIDEIPADTLDVKYDFDLRVKTQLDNRTQVEVWADMAYKIRNTGEVRTLDSEQVSLTIRRPEIEVDVSQLDEEKGIIPGGSAELEVNWENTGDGISSDLSITISSNNDNLVFESDDGTGGATLEFHMIYPDDQRSKRLRLFAKKNINTEIDEILDIDVSYSDMAGNPYKDFSEQFTIRVNTNPEMEQPFRIDEFNPPNDSTEVAVDMELTARFSLPVDKDTIEGSVTIEPSVQFDAIIEGNGTQLRIKFHQDLEKGTKYTVTISQGIKDEYGRDLEQEYHWTFTTVKEKEETTQNQLAAPCILVLLLVIIAAIVLGFLFYRQKKMKERVEELKPDEESEAEEPDIVYAPDREIEPVTKKTKAVKAKPMVKKDKKPKTIDIEAAVVAKPDMDISLDTEPSTEKPEVEAEPDDEEPGDMDDLERDLSLGDPYKIDLALLQTPGSGEGPSRPILALPPAVILDTEEPEEGTPYSIDEIFVMTQEGILVQHFTAKSASAIDEDILAGMLTAVQMFIKDTFGGSAGEGTLDELSLGDFKIMIGRGSYITISAILSGEETDLVRPQLDAMVEDIETMYKDVLEDWDGDMASVGSIQDNIKSFVEGKYQDEE